MYTYIASFQCATLYGPRDEATRTLSLSFSLSLSLSTPSLSSQPILSETVLEQHRENKSLVPPGMTPDKYVDVMVCK